MARMAGTPGTPRVLRAMNDRAALDLLLEHGTLSRTRIGKLTGLSKPTASQLLARLEAAGLVLATGTTAGRPGPNAQLYSVNPAAAHVAGLDVNTERIRAAVADITGRTVGSFRLPTPHRRAGSAVEQVVQAVDGAAKAAGLGRTDLHRIVIGTPGAFDPSTGRLRYASHLPGWHSPALLDELAAALP
ncbi:ROK family transcriptional regulator, partial [Actinacidiphila rubida]